MSEFSGKCDVCDCLRDRSDEYLQNSKFFIYGTDHRDHQLVINSQKDLAKYYPYLTCSMGADKNGAHVYITSQSFIDREEAERINWVKNDLVKYYKKCKRNKIQYTADEAIKAALWFNPSDWEIELARRVGEAGDKAETKDLHTSIHEYFRERWCEELISQGYTEDEARLWVYGWDRVWEEKKDEREKKESEAEDK